MMVAGTAPDIIAAWSAVFRRWADRGQLMDLQPLVDRDFTAEQVADYHKFQWDGLVTRETKIRYALPYYVNIAMLYYSKPAFDEAGVEYPTKDWTRDDYTEALANLTTKENDQVVRWGGYIPMNYGRIQPTIHSFGGWVANPDDWTECLLGETEAQAALEWIRARMWDDNSLAQPMQYGSVGEATGSSTGAWAAGKLASAEDGLGWITAYVNESEFAWDLAHLPQGPGQAHDYGNRRRLGDVQGLAAR